MRNIGRKMMEEKRSLQQQIDLLYEKYQRATSLKEARVIYASLEALHSAHFAFFKEEYNPQNLGNFNTHYVNRIIETQNHKLNLFTNNFYVAFLMRLPYMIVHRKKIIKKIIYSFIPKRN